MIAATAYANDAAVLTRNPADFIGLEPLVPRCYYDGSPATRHARNLARNPACSLSLEDGRQAVILEGRSDAARAHPDGLGARLAEAFRKYHAQGYAPTADAWSAEDGGGLRVFRPRIALAWTRYPQDATRFVFTG